MMLPLVIANFSPGTFEQNQVLVVLLSYSAIFFSRPFGAVIFAHLADMHGRKKILVTTVTIMGFAMLLLAVCPPQKIVGIASIAFLLLFIFLQGIAAGGDTPVTMAYMYENMDKKRWAVNGFFNIFFIFKGIFLANILVILFIHYSTLGFLGKYSWRYLFLFSSFCSLLALKERLKLPEKKSPSVVFHKSSFFQSLKGVKNQLGLGLLIFAADGAVFNMFIGSFYPYTSADVNRAYEFIGSTTAILFSFFLYKFSYKLSPKKLLKLSLYLLLILTVAQYFIDPIKAMGPYRLFFVLPATLYVASIFYILPSLFKEQYRAFGVACLFVMVTFFFGMSIITLIKYLFKQNMHVLTSYMSILILSSIVGAYRYKEPQ